jgi:HSP20 family protein
MFEAVPLRRIVRDLLDSPPREMKDMFDRSFEYYPRLRVTRRFCPCVSVSETEKEPIVKADIPGIEPKDIDIVLSDGMITIKGEKKEEKGVESEEYRRMERCYRSFTRNVRLPYEVKEKEVKAEYENGVLTIRLPRTETIKGKHIEINTN